MLLRNLIKIKLKILKLNTQRFNFNIINIFEGWPWSTWNWLQSKVGGLKKKNMAGRVRLNDLEVRKQNAKYRRNLRRAGLGKSHVPHPKCQSGRYKVKLSPSIQRITHVSRALYCTWNAADLTKSRYGNGGAVSSRCYV